MKSHLIIFAILSVLIISVQSSQKRLQSSHTSQEKKPQLSVQSDVKVTPIPMQFKEKSLFSELQAPKSLIFDKYQYLQRFTQNHEESIKPKTQPLRSVLNSVRFVQTEKKTDKQKSNKSVLNVNLNAVKTKKVAKTAVKATVPQQKDSVLNIFKFKKNHKNDPNPYYEYMNHYRFAEKNSKTESTKSLAVLKNQAKLKAQAKAVKELTIKNAKVIAKAKIDTNADVKKQKADKKSEILQWAKNIKNVQTINMNAVLNLLKNPIFKKAAKQNNDKKDFTNLDNKFVLAQRIEKAEEMERIANKKIIENEKKMQKYGNATKSQSQLNRRMQAAKRG